MEWKKGTIDGVITQKLVKYVDERGFLTETVRLDQLPEGLQPVMSYVSYTEPGVSRGPHEHEEQTDIFAFIGPGNFKVRLWDNREGSETYGKYMEFYVGQDSPTTVVIPPGIVHGYKNVSKTERGMVINYPDRLFMGWGKKELIDEIRHEDDTTSPFQMES
ncbi:dTDP-4-dehydrorhamnose 3,5-epimerase family protein [Metallumcola ferriviriculae]|uniref:dTDP-4-dehydrorhamnose 3,5-epimerase family protein n=1 Tax=Metallumcola ferriviriculae TaxID=3039180 RepID=A0AAU0UKI2_9FIRM|nr:dTDP-4-dehydrorhamnose 3,5-epimerase family protein [Desulfitibacteraceae bacterium MK1]